jgi:transposase
MMPRDQRFTQAFKLEVVKIVREQGKAVSQVAKSHRVSQTAIRRWLSLLPTDNDQVAAAGQPLTMASPQRIRSLEQENRELRAEVDLLRRAAAYFANHMV